MTKPIRILLQSTIPYTEDHWHIGRYSMLRDHLASATNENGEPLFDVTARNIERNADGNDAVLSRLDETDFEEVWLFAVDLGDGMTPDDCAGITRFRQRGGGILATRDHEDLGKSLCTLGGIGKAHFFHSQNPEPDESRRTEDDNVTTNISWPNYHSGNNGDYQRIIAVEPMHDLLQRPDSNAGRIELFPAHPHEGAVGVPDDERNARVVAMGKSLTTGRQFNLVVAFDRAEDKHGNTLGRGIVESSFHHLVDYNWDVDKGCPSFVEEPPGDGYKKEPAALEDIKAYVRNAAIWLAPAVS